MLIKVLIPSQKFSSYDLEKSDIYVLAAQYRQYNMSTKFRLLTSGNNSEIFLYQGRMILKMVDIHRKSEIKHLRNQFECMKTLSHPNILKVFELRQNIPTKGNPNLSQDQKRDVLIMEYANMGSLLDVLKTQIGVDGKKMIAKQLVEAVSYLHNVERMAHRDIKLDNVLVKEESTGLMRALLSDFGFAIRQPVEAGNKTQGVANGSPNESKLSTNESNVQRPGQSNETFSNPTTKPKPTNPLFANSYKGTEAYMAPELHKILNGPHPYDPFKVDVFSLGVTLHLIFFHKLPFGIAIEKKDLIFRLFSENRFSEFWAKNEIDELRYPKLNMEDLKNLLEGMLCVNPKERMTMQEVLESPFIQSIGTIMVASNGEKIGTQSTTNK